MPNYQYPLSVQNSSDTPRSLIALLLHYFHVFASPPSSIHFTMSFLTMSRPPSISVASVLIFIYFFPLAMFPSHTTTCSQREYRKSLTSFTSLLAFFIVSHIILFAVITTSGPRIEDNNSTLHSSCFLLATMFSKLFWVVV